MKAKKTLTLCLPLLATALLLGQQANAQWDFFKKSDEKKEHSEAAVNPAEDQELQKVKRLQSEGGDLSQVPKSVWKKLLPRAQYKVLWESDTERRFTNEKMGNGQAGTFVSAACRLPVFRSEHKYDSGTGWPSFWETNKDNIVLKKDYSWGMRRTEILSKCGEHLGHVFDDGPSPTGKRYCINSLALKFVPDSKSDAKQSLLSEQNKQALSLSP